MNEYTPTPQTSIVLGDLSGAASEYAAAAEAFVFARERLNAAKGRWHELAAMLSKNAEQEGV